MTISVADHVTICNLNLHKKGRILSDSPHYLVGNSDFAGRYALGKRSALGEFHRMTVENVLPDLGRLHHFTRPVRPHRGGVIEERIVGQIP